MDGCTEKACYNVPNGTLTHSGQGELGQLWLLSGMGRAAGAREAAVAVIRPG